MSAIPGGTYANLTTGIVYQVMGNGAVKPLYGSVAAAPSLSALDAACVVADIPWHLDTDFTLTANTTLASEIIGAGGVITRGGYTLTGNFWAPPTVQMFDAAGTGLVTITNGWDRQLGWFGAIGNGTAAGGGFDNTNALNSAMASTYYSSPNGFAQSARLRIPAGTFRYTSKFIIANAESGGGLSVMGEGRGQSVLLADFINDDAVLINPTGAITVSGVGVYASTARQAGASGNGILCQSTDSATTQNNVSLIDIDVFNHPGDGVKAIDPEMAYWRDVWSTGNLGQGFRWFTSTERGISNLMENCRAVDNQGRGFSIEGGVINSTCIHYQGLNNGLNGATTEDVFVNGSCLNIIFINPDLEQNGGNANTMDAFKISGSYHTIKSAVISAFGGKGINFSDCTYSVIDNPRMRGDSISHPMTYGVYLINSMGNCVLMPDNFSLSDVTTPFFYDAATSARNRVHIGDVPMELDFRPAFATPYAPDISTGLNFKLIQQEGNNLTANLTVSAPVNLPLTTRDFEISFEFQQDSVTGTYTITWNSAFVTSWSNSGVGVNKRSFIAFRYSVEEAKWIQTRYLTWT